MSRIKLNASARYMHQNISLPYLVALIVFVVAVITSLLALVIVSARLPLLAVSTLASGVAYVAVTVGMIKEKEDA